MLGLKFLLLVLALVHCAAAKLSFPDLSLLFPNLFETKTVTITDTANTVTKTSTIETSVTRTVTTPTTVTDTAPGGATPIPSNICAVECLNFQSNWGNLVGETEGPMSYQQCWSICSTTFNTTTYVGLFTDFTPPTPYYCLCYTGEVQGPAETNCAESSDPAYDDGNYYMYGIYNNNNTDNSIMAVVPC